MNDDGKAGAVRAGGMPATEEATPPHGAGTGPRATSTDHSSDAGLNAFARTRLGTHLRAMYDAVVQQPVPDQFRDLIARLEASEARTAGSPQAEAQEAQTSPAPDADANRRGA